mmetsp:Transcript_20437/g.19760  ORF Transcript_20437/g.19760 Transcript_20437/m.19760 type:complete len:87 (+) Transcript_20437:1422-1682(+)
MNILEGVLIVPFTEIQETPSAGGLGNVMSLSCVFFFVAMMREDENESKNEKRVNYNTIQCNETISCDGGGKRYQTKIAFYEIQPFT